MKADWLDYISRNASWEGGAVTTEPFCFHDNGDFSHHCLVYSPAIWLSNMIDAHKTKLTCVSTEAELVMNLGSLYIIVLCGGNWCDFYFNLFFWSHGFVFCTDVGQRIISQKSVVGTRLVSAFTLPYTFTIYKYIFAFLGLTILNEDTK